MDNKKLSELQNMTPAELLKAMHDSKQKPNKKLSTNNEFEEYVATLWNETFPNGGFDVNSDFFDLGGTSLQAVLMLSKFKDKYDLELDLVELFKATTIKAQAQLLQESISGVSKVKQEYDYQKDINFVNLIDISPLNTSSHDFNQVLLTGATGFLGIHLIKELLQQSDCHLYCIVRASSNDAGMSRILESAKKYKLDLSKDEFKRIHCLCGDLSKPKLNLSDSDYKTICMNCDLIIHSAALVNFVSPYEKLREANVLSLFDLMKIASKEKIKPIHFVSSVGVFNNLFDDNDVINEQTRLSDDAPISGYFQTKWVCEKMCELARKKGIPISIYRPSGITINMHSMVTSQDDLTYTFLRLSKKIGMLADLESIVDVVPVDYAAKIMTYLLINHPKANMTYHITAGEKLSVSQFVENFPQDLGIRIVDYSTYLKQANDYILKSDDKLIRSLSPLLIGNQLFSSEKPVKPSVFDSTATQKSLRFKHRPTIEQCWTALFKQLSEAH